MPFRIAVIPGDGIGPEVIAQGLRVLDAVTAATGTQLERVTYDLERLMPGAIKVGTAAFASAIIENMSGAAVVSSRT